MDQNEHHRDDPARADCPRPRLLIVEPDRLTRWAIEEHLRHTFQVTAAETEAAAYPLLERGSFDAIVVADDLPTHGADAVEAFARARNPRIAAVRTVTHRSEQESELGEAVVLEKPFELAALARALEGYDRAESPAHMPSVSADGRSKTPHSGHGPVTGRCQEAKVQFG